MDKKMKLENEKGKKSFIDKLKTDKKTQVITIVAVAVLALIIVLIFFFATNDDIKFSDLLNRENEEVVEEVNARHLDGIVVEEGKENLYPTAVMVENLSTIRPQAGLSSAGIVYEALAEGGITRFMAVFAGESAEVIGPVRSARSYYIEWVSEYDAMYTFSGAYPPVLQAVSGLGIKDLNAMYAGSKYFYRDSSRAAPHNLFTDSEKIGFGLRDYEYDTITPEYEPWKFQDEANIDDRVDEEKSLTIDFSSAGYTVEYKYDKETNTYLRFNPIGTAHIDRNTGEQLAPKNIALIRIEKRVIDNEGRLEMDVVGEGEAVLFKNGMVYKGTWKKDSRTDRTRFYNEDGSDYEFVRGQTWVEVVPPERDVTYTE